MIIEATKGLFGGFAGFDEDAGMREAYSAHYRDAMDTDRAEQRNRNRCRRDTSEPRDANLKSQDTKHAGLRGMKMFSLRRTRGVA